MLNRRSFLQSASVLSALPLAAHAQGDFPNKPVTIVVPFAAGQSGDVLARLLGEGLTKIWGKTLVVDNKSGAGGTLGSQFVKAAPADGYTLLLGSSGPMAIAPHLIKNAGYDPRKDFTPIMVAAGVAQVLVVNANSPIRTLKDLVAAAKAKPGKVTYGSGGNGSTQHLTMEYLNDVAGIDMLHVPYKGTTPAYNDLFGGQIDALFDSQPGVMPFLQAGKARVLAVSTAQRVPSLPDVPTVAESGYAGFDVLGWLGIVAPKGLDPAIQRKLNEDFKKALALDTVKANLARLGMISVGNSPEEFARYIASEYDKFGTIIKKAKITIE